LLYPEDSRKENDKLIRERLVVVSDFDGTLTPVDVGDSIVRHFVGQAAAVWNDKWINQEIGSQTLYREVYRLFEDGERDLERFIDGFQLDEGLIPMLDFLKKQGIGFLVTSDGFDFYIDRLFKRSGVNVPVFCNHLTFKDQRPVVSFPAANPLCQRCGTCKAGVVRSLHGRGYQVIYLGDGYSDRYPACFADLVFAKDTLARLCQEHSIHYEPFRSCIDIVKALETKWLQEATLPGSKHHQPHRERLPSDSCVAG